MTDFSTEPSGWRQCVRCVMDTTDPEIHFDAAGVCSHCHLYEDFESKNYRSEEERATELARIVKQIKADGRGGDYDCVIGVSGGVDSTYAAYLVSQLGLRPLAIHLDNGWNSEQAVRNIERTLQVLKIDLHTHVLDWDEFRDLQISFLRGSTPDGEIPTDHAIAALLYSEAVRNGVKYIINGRNVVTEAVAPRAWAQGHGDWKYIRSVHARFGTRKLRSYPHYGIASLGYYILLKRLSVVSILDNVSYVKSDVMTLIREKLGWEYYGGKHYESIYTRFFQGYILPTKFNIDKRKAHLSTLVCSGQITRDKAVEQLAAPIYPEGLIEQDRRYVLKKLELSETEFQRIMTEPRKSFWDYPSYKRSPIFRSKKILDFYRQLKG